MPCSKCGSQWDRLNPGVKPEAPSLQPGTGIKHFVLHLPAQQPGDAQKAEADLLQSRQSRLTSPRQEQEELRSSHATGSIFNYCQAALEPGCLSAPDCSFAVVAHWPGHASSQQHTRRF